MDTQIPWWHSKTIWLGLLQVAVGVLVATGWMTDTEGQQALGYADEVFGTAIAALAAAGVWGRVSARSAIKPDIIPPASGGSQRPTKGMQG